MSKLQIPEEAFNQIMSELGYPILSVEELGNNKVTEDQVKDILILPVLKQTFFRYLPIKLRDEYSVGTSFEIAYPNDYIISVLDARMITRFYGSSGRTQSPFINAINIRQVKSHRYGTGNDYDFSIADIYKRAENQAWLESEKAVKVYNDRKSNKIKGFTNAVGRLAVTWGMWSDNWEDVPLQFESIAIRLAQSAVLHYFGMIRMQDNSDLPTSVDGQPLVDRARDLREEVMEELKSITKVVLIRN